MSASEEIPGQLELFSAKAERDHFEEFGDILWAIEDAYWERLRVLDYEEYEDGIGTDQDRLDASDFELIVAEKFKTASLTWRDILAAQTYAVFASRHEAELDVAILNQMAALASWLRHLRNR